MLVLLALACWAVGALDIRLWKYPWMNLGDDPAGRAKKLLANMTIDDKISMLHGVGLGYIGNVAPIDRLGIPQLNLNDGPQGFRTSGSGTNKFGTSTGFPGGQTVGMTWDRDLARAWGEAMGKEFAKKGSNVQLGPGVNVARVPRNGRNFEYISGEDPYLGSQMVPPVIQGIQSQGVIANCKHYINNNEEFHRNDIIEKLDERTQYEIYMPPFEAGVKAGLGSVMCSYNKIWIFDKEDTPNWSCENKETLTNELRGYMGFKGWVMSDWGATHSTDLAANAGLDQEMPRGNYFGKTLKNSVTAGNVTMDTLDQKVLRILTPMFQFGLFDDSPAKDGDIGADVTSAEASKLTRDIGAAATVLLQNNDNLLPISGTDKKIAVIGRWANDTCSQVLNPHSPCTSGGSTFSGGGSGSVQPKHIITLLKAINERMAGGSGSVTYANNVDAAVQAAKNADYVIFQSMTNSHEGTDRKNLSLPPWDLDFIDKVSDAAGDKMVVVFTGPGAVLTPFRDNVGAVLAANFPGQEGGYSISDVLFGDVNPSGRLTITMPKTETDLKMTEDQYPGVQDSNGQYTATYSEKLEVGYRWYHAHDVTPAFAFGHGLSYTKFDYSNVQVTQSGQGAQVTLTLKNTGLVAGAEVVQVYVTFPESAGEPPRQLKGFEKKLLQPGASADLTIDLDERAFQIWQGSWTQPQGTFKVEVGASSRDMRHSQKLRFI